MDPILILIIVVTVLMYLSHKVSQTRFRDRFPPLSDEEFLKRCSPGTDPAIALGVRRIVSEQLGIPYERIYPESNFARDLGRD